ncbi:uncharacterized protein [Periplaneta americana]|uniref:uncharacterized protein n=1 Tax=Periplaneta americana TaxID=6978 RepID=UPI0037E81C00
MSPALSAMSASRKMKIGCVAACIALMAGTVSCGLVSTTLVRAPSFDSAIIQSDRLGGNFAYSTAEGHAYAAVSPVVQHVLKPVAVSYTAQPVVYAPAPFVAAPAVISVPQTVVSSVVASPAVPEAPEDSVADEAEATEVSEDAVEVEA